MSPHVSIIVPMYDVEGYVGECFESLLRQTEGDFEVIAVDDGSTDATLDVARRVAGGDGRFRFFRQGNRGQSAARNFALGQAAGDYVLFLDADDFYRDDALAVLAQRAAADDLDYLDFTAQTFYESADLKHRRRDDYDRRPEIPGVMDGMRLFVAYQQRHAYHCSPCLHYFKRALLENPPLRFDVGHIHEDELFSPQLLARARRAAYLDEPLYMRRVRGDSSMTQTFGIRNVHGAFTSAQKLEAWMHECAGNAAPDFVDALAQRVFEVREILTWYIDATPEAGLDAYAEGLDPRTRADFQVMRNWAEYVHGLYHSHAFRAGRAIMAGPSWLKRHLGR